MVDQIRADPRALHGPASGPTTPEAAARAFISSGKPEVVTQFLATVPPQNLSSTSVKLVIAVAASPEALNKLANSPEHFPVMLRSLAQAPTDPTVGTAISTLMAARPVAPRAPEPEAPKTPGWVKGRSLEGRPSYPFGAAMPEGMAQPLYPKTYGNEIKDGEIKTEGGRWGSGRTVSMVCDYEVSVRNPKTGEVERVLFEAVEQKRAAPWGLGKWYDTAQDVDSRVLVCEGHQYSPKELKINTSGKGPIERYISGGIERTQAFRYDSIPSLKARVEEYARSGETGNAQAKKRWRP